VAPRTFYRDDSKSAAGLVLDPFAGGSVRGIVANKLGRRYCGIDPLGAAD
jgi:DNA modification methylase